MDPRVPPTLDSAIDMVLDNQARMLSVSLPGVVVAYDGAARTATIQPAVNRLVPYADDPEGDASERLPVLFNVPVCWPCGSNFEVVGTLDAGDPVLLVCQDRDISQWRASGALSDPSDSRTHSWASAVAIPGIKHDNLAKPAPVTDAAALASSVRDELDRLWAALDSHVHATNGAPPNGTTTPLVVAWSGAVAGSGAAGPVASTVLKLKE